jgi:hypothetical protein
VIASGLFGAGVAVLTLTLNGLTNGAFWLNVVAANAGTFDGTALVGYLVNFTTVHPIVLTFACSEAWRMARGGRWSPWMLGFGASLFEALLVGHPGAGESYFLNAIATASVLAGAAIARLSASFVEPPQQRSELQSGAGWRIRSSRVVAYAADPLLLLGALLLVQSLLMAHGPLSRHIPQLPDRGLQAWALGRVPSTADRTAGDDVVELMRASVRPVLSEEPSFAIVAGKQPSASASHLRDLDDKRLWDATALVSDVEQRRFGVIVLSAQRYPPAVLEAIGRSYYVVRAAPIGATTYLIFLPGG